MSNFTITWADSGKTPSDVRLSRFAISGAGVLETYVIGTDGREKLEAAYAANYWLSITPK